MQRIHTWCCFWNGGGEQNIDLCSAFVDTGGEIIGFIILVAEPYLPVQGSCTVWTNLLSVACWRIEVPNSRGFRYRRNAFLPQYRNRFLNSVNRLEDWIRCLVFCECSVVALESVLLEPCSTGVGSALLFVSADIWVVVWGKSLYRIRLVGRHTWIWSTLCWSIRDLIAPICWRYCWSG